MEMEAVLTRRQPGEIVLDLHAIVAERSERDGSRDARVVEASDLGDGVVVVHIVTDVLDDGLIGLGVRSVALARSQTDDEENAE